MNSLGSTREQFSASTGQIDTVKKIGTFRLIDWGSGLKGEKAFEAAQDWHKKLVEKHTTPQGYMELNEGDMDAYFGYAQAVYERPNVGITTGLLDLLAAACGLFNSGTSPLVLNTTHGVFGGPASISGNNKGFLGIGNGTTSTTTTAALAAAGATSVTVASITGFSTGDIVYLSDSTTGTPGANAEYVILSGASAGTLSFSTTPTRFAHNFTSMVVVRAGSPTQTDLAGASKFYKGIDTSFPTVANVSGVATATWQATYGTTEAQYAWNESIIGAVPSANTPPNAGSGSAGTSTFPSSAVLLAAATWYPSPLTKGASVVSQQYQFQVK